MKRLLFICFCLYSSAKAQQADSLKVVTAFRELLQICRTVDFNDPKVRTEGIFYKAARYIVYRGADKKRNWKSMANYANAEEKKGVDEVCYRINASVNRDSNYHIIKYETQKESEGVWHVLVVSYLKKGVQKEAIFAFLKIGGRYGLGDID